MNGVTLLRIKELFLAASDLPPDARAAFLDAQGDLPREARAQVEEQLALLEETDDSALAHPRATSAADEDPLYIGPYRVLRRLGEGGMGVVYLAEQTAPLARQVAVKRVRAGMDSRAMLRRFEAERQALERMDHPAIARVLDAGVDEGGRPYFVMEFVDGVSIVDHCDGAELDPDARLRLFAEVCRGVQHAHQKGVIHRDLKPSNVLVATVDGRPAPKIIDFGVAKALERERTEQTLQTQFGMMIGTPEYMSPEQAEPGAVDVDTRSDVYSLGVLLYELLSGELPFEPAYLRERGLASIRRVLSEEEPSRPSTRVVPANERTTERARRRRLAPAALAERLRGELDWITLRALEKERDRRYGSAGELADDVERHLRHEPVLAGPPTARYRLVKYLRRHRVQAASAAAIALALLVGAGGALWFALDARAERDRAIALAAERDAARREAESAIESVRATLGRSALRLEDAFASGLDTPAAEAETHTMLGEAFLGIGDLDAAARHLARAIELLREVPDSWPDQAHRVMRSYSHLRLVGDWSMRILIMELLERTQMAALAGGDPRMTSALERLRSHSVADPDDEPFERLMQAAEATFAPGDPRWHVLPAFIAGKLDGPTRRDARVERILRIQSQLDVPKHDPRLLMDQLFCVQHFDNKAVGAWPEGLALAEDALAKLRGNYRRDHYLVGAFELERGYSLAHLGQYESAWPSLVNAQAILEQELGPSSILTVWALLARVQWFDLQERGAESEAQELRALLAERVAICPGRANAEWVEGALVPEFADLVTGLTTLEAVPIVPGDAQPVAARLLSAAEVRLAPDDPRRAVVASYLAWVGERLSKAGASRQDMIDLFEGALALTAGHEEWERGTTRWWLANHRYRHGDHARAAEVAAPWATAPSGTRDAGLQGMLMVQRGLSRFELGEQEAGLAEAIDGYQRCAAALGDQNGNVITALNGIAEKLAQVGRRGEAVELYRELLRRQATWHSGVDVLWRTADAAFRTLGSEQPAADVLEVLRRRHPNDWRTSALEAAVAAIHFDASTVREHAAILLENDVRDAPVLNSVARHCARVGLGDEADAAARLALERSDTRGLRNNRAVWKLRLGDVDRAQEDFEALVASEPDSTFPWLNLAKCWLQRGDTERALAAAQRAWELDPDVGQRVLGRVLLARGEVAEAVPHLRATVMALGRPDGAPYLEDYADALARVGSVDEARAHLARLTDEWPSEPFAWSQRALALCRFSPDGPARAEDLAVALESAERAVALTEGRGPVMLATLAEVAFQRGDVERALASCDETLAVLGGRNAAWLTVAEMERRRERYAAAR